MRRLSLAAVVLLVACSGSATEEVLVSSAASLTDVFAAIEIEFERTNPDIDIVLNVGGSSALREQILAGAPADVFASANLANMDAVAAGGFVRDDPMVFAQNRLEIAVPIDNPGSVTGLDDFANPDLLLGLCSPAVPCGDFALRALASAGIEPTVDTNEPDVRALLTKIEAGELDAGIVYATDVVSRSGDIAGVPIPTAFNVVAEYPIAVLTGGTNAPGATLFVDFVASSSGRAILAEHGFVLP
jgi:molybdate transport system substrate-binding protein